MTNPESAPSGLSTATLLEALMSGENEIRSQAEVSIPCLETSSHVTLDSLASLFVFQKTYENLPVGQRIQLLFNALSSERNSIPVDGRQMAAVMLRRCMTSYGSEFFPTVRIH